MEKIDFSPIKATMDNLTLQLAIILGVPLIIGLIVRFLLGKLLPDKAANIGTSFVVLIVAYKTFLIVTGIN